MNVQPQTPEPSARPFLVVSGLPASGKTTLARRMAQALGLPLLDKDDILEALFDGLGVGDAEWRQRLSRAADAVLRRLAEQSAGAVLASFWRHPTVGGASGTPTAWLAGLSSRVVELYCVCSPAAAAERFLARARHAGHLDREKQRQEVMASFVGLAAQGPLALAPVVRADTERRLDLDDVLAQVQSVWSPG